MSSGTYSTWQVHLFCTYTGVNKVLSTRDIRHLSSTLGERGKVRVVKERHAVPWLAGSDGQRELGVDVGRAVDDCSGLQWCQLRWFDRLVAGSKRAYLLMLDQVVEVLVQLNDVVWIRVSCGSMSGRLRETSSKKLTRIGQVAVLATLWA